MWWYSSQQQMMMRTHARARVFLKNKNKFMTDMWNHNLRYVYKFTQEISTRRPSFDR